MKFLRKINPEWPLRIGLGLMYLYSGPSLITNTKFWYGYTPIWFLKIISRFTTIDTYLKFQGGVEVLFGIVFLLWLLPYRLVKIVTVLAAIQMVLILLFVRVNIVTFRDLATLGGLLALFIILHRMGSENTSR